MADRVSGKFVGGLVCVSLLATFGWVLHGRCGAGKGARARRAEGVELVVAEISKGQISKI